MALIEIAQILINHVYSFNKIKNTVFPAPCRKNGLVFTFSDITKLCQIACIPVVKVHIPTVFEEGQAIAPAPFSSTVVSVFKTSDALNYVKRAKICSQVILGTFVKSVNRV